MNFYFRESHQNRGENSINNNSKRNLFLYSIGRLVDLNHPFLFMFFSSKYIFFFILRNFFPLYNFFFFPLFCCGMRTHLNRTKRIEIINCCQCTGQQQNERTNESKCILCCFSAPYTIAFLWNRFYKMILQPEST